MGQFEITDTIPLFYNFVNTFLKKNIFSLFFNKLGVFRHLYYQQIGYRFQPLYFL